jgi:plasmid stability protein
MTHQINLPDPLEQKLRERAAAAGTDAETFIVQTLARSLQAPKTYREIFAPLHQAFGEAPISEDELTALVDQARIDRLRRSTGTP